MALVPLRITGWAYDDETKHIVATFVDTPGPDHEDPVGFVSSRSYQIELLPRAVDETAVEQPEQGQIDQIETVVDQLVLDVLMSSLGVMPEV